MPVTIIAEIGVNHNGSMEQARKLIKASKEAGADIAKFQYFQAESLVTRDAPLALYQRANLNSKKEATQLEMLSGLELTLSQLVELKEFAHHTGIEFLASVFDQDDLEKVAYALDLKRMKIPSGEINNQLYVERCASLGLPLILSTGMATIEEVANAVEWCLNASPSSLDLTILQCTSNYPAGPDELNLLALHTLGNEFKYPVGFSDHSEGSSAAIAAVALGAVVIEKHITFDRNANGPDHRASASIDDFREYCTLIRTTERHLGDGVKLPSANELLTKKIVRKSPVCSNPILKGEKFTTSNTRLVRPETDLPGQMYSELLGVKSSRTYAPGDPISIEELRR